MFVSFSRSLVPLGLVTVWFFAGSLEARPTRFIAQLADGSRVEGNQLTDWHSTQATPKLEGQPLFAPQQPLRWLRDRWLTPAARPEAVVELINGDRVPGRVVRFAGVDLARFDDPPHHAVVEPHFLQQPPAGSAAGEIRIVSRFIRRITWSEPPPELSPNTLALRDGRLLSFQAVRLAGSTVELLTREGPRRFSLDELAALQLDTADPWNAYFDELAVLTPDGSSRLLQIETTDGLIATTSLERFGARGDGSPSDFTRWYHAVQPAWSLELLWIPHMHIGMRRCFAAHEVPLTRFLPRDVANTPRNHLSGGKWQLNQNVLGGPLRPAGEEVGWGFGVHAESRLSFPLHAAVRTLHTRFALDRAAGSGGCVKAHIASADTPGQPWYSSGFVVGSDQMTDCGSLAIPTGDSRPSELILHADPAHAGRPPGADPFTIRDLADWVEPWFELDPAAVESEIARRRGWGVPAWDGWQVAMAPTSPRRVNLPDDMSVPPGRYRAAFASTDEPLVLSSTRRLTAADRWLVVGAHRVQDSAPPIQIEVRVADELIFQGDIPRLDRSHRDGQPICVSLAGFAGRTDEPVRVEVQQSVGSEEVPVVWRALRFTSHRPTLRCAFDELSSDQGIEVGGVPETEGEAEFDGTANVIGENPYTGRLCLQVDPGEETRLAWNQPLAIRELPQWGEFRFLRFAVRKPKVGSAQITLHRGGGAEPVTLFAGPGAPDDGTRVVHNASLSDRWTVITRDLYADLGASEVEALTIESADDHPAVFDHIYLARSPGILDRIPRASVEAPDDAELAQVAEQLSERLLPSVVRLTFADERQAMGIAIDTSGNVLTVGHALPGPNQAVQVHLSDGRELTGHTRGVWRDADLGLIQIEEPDGLPAIAMNTNSDWPLHDPLFTALSDGAGEAHALSMVSVRPRRVFHGSFWTGGSRATWLAGEPLFDRAGRLVALQSRANQLGGLMATRVHVAPPELERLKRSEVWGRWPMGVEPAVGLSLRKSDNGVEITRIVPESPAHQAGLRTGDILTRVHGREIGGEHDFSAALAETNPGDQVATEFVRDGTPVTATIALEPRVP